MHDFRVVREESGERDDEVRIKPSSKILQIIFLSVAVLPITYVSYKYVRQDVETVGNKISNTVMNSFNKTVGVVKDKEEETKKKREERQKESPKSDIIPSLDTIIP